MARCASDERCRRVIRPPSGYDNNEAEAEEVCQHKQNSKKVQRWTAQEKRHTNSIQVSLSNRFQLLHELTEDRETDIETQWEDSKKLWHSTCEDVLGKRATQHKEWIFPDTIQKLKARKKRKTDLNTSRTRAAKAKAQIEYRTADGEVKRSIGRTKGITSKTWPVRQRKQPDRGTSKTHTW